MKILLRGCEGFNEVIVTNGETVKFMNEGFSKGTFEGVNLYAEDTVERLREHFKEIDEAGNMNDYDNIWSAIVFDFDIVSEEVEGATLVYET